MFSKQKHKHSLYAAVGGEIRDNAQWPLRNPAARGVKIQDKESWEIQIYSCDRLPQCDNTAGQHWTPPPVSQDADCKFCLPNLPQFSPPLTAKHNTWKNRKKTEVDVTTTIVLLWKSCKMSHRLHGVPFPFILCCRITQQRVTKKATQSEELVLAEAMERRELIWSVLLCLAGVA